MWVNNGSQAAAAKIVIERLDGRPLRLVTQFDAHSGGVHNPAITQVSELLTIQLGVVIRSPQRIQSPYPKPWHRHRNSPGPPDRLRQHEDAVGSDVERSGLAGHRRALQRTQRILLVQQLQSRITAEDRRDQRPGQIS